MSCAFPHRQTKTKLTMDRQAIFLAKIFLVLICFGSIQLTQAAYLKCYHSTIEHPQSTPLESPLPLLNNASCIDTVLDTVIYVHGFTGNATKHDTVTIITAYLSLGNSNVLFLDWAEEAGVANLGPVLGYLRAASNVETVGKKFATAILELADAGLDLDKLHIVGFSLGAQLAGVAGKEVCSQQGPLISRITGLDPAGPLFGGPVSLFDKLNKDSAKFVDVVHGDPGGYGIKESVGTVDFWPNYNPIKVIQPGCNVIPVSTDDSFCSHERSVEFFRESILNGTAFLGSGQNNYASWIINNGTTDRVECLGEFVSRGASGNFYLITNSKSPYGKGKDGLTPL